MTCKTITDGKKVTGFICYTPTYHTFVGKNKKRVEFSYGPYYGVEVYGKDGKRRRGTKMEWEAIKDWLHRNTYHRGNKEFGREIIGYVKPKWKP